MFMVFIILGIAVGLVIIIVASIKLSKAHSMRALRGTENFSQEAYEKLGDNGRNLLVVGIVILGYHLVKLLINLPLQS